jgi:hypothetical protein
MAGDTIGVLVAWTATAAAIVISALTYAHARRHRKGQRLHRALVARRGCGSQ